MSRIYLQETRFPFRKFTKAGRLRSQAFHHFYFFFSSSTFFFFLWMNSLRRKVRDVANLVGCMSIFTSHLQFVLFIFFLFFLSFFLPTLHESIAPSRWGISRTDKGILQFPSKRLTITLQSTARWSPCSCFRPAPWWSAGAVPLSLHLYEDPLTL